MRRLEVVRSARLDIDRILIESERRWSPAAAERYRGLIELALAELREDPAPPASKPAQGELRLYALRFPARRLDPDRIVRSPPHVVVYRYDAERVQILRLLHEAMDLPRHLRALIAPESLDDLRDDRARDDPDAGGED